MLKSDFRKAFDDAATAFMMGDADALANFVSPKCTFHIPGATQPITDARMLRQAMQPWRQLFPDFGQHTDDQVEFHDDKERKLTVIQHMNLTQQQQPGRRSADTDTLTTPWTEVCHVLERDRQDMITDWRMYFGAGPATQDLMAAAMSGQTGMGQEDLLTDTTSSRRDRDDMTHAGPLEGRSDRR